MIARTAAVLAEYETDLLCFLVQCSAYLTSWLVHVRTGEGKLFAPGNLRPTFDNPDYEKLINYYIGEKYTLRYTGGLVPDVLQIIVKEKGVFCNVTSPSTKAKLRILFEVALLALLVSALSLLCLLESDLHANEQDITIIAPKVLSAWLL